MHLMYSTQRLPKMAEADAHCCDANFAVMERLSPVFFYKNGCAILNRKKYLLS